jgi:diaminopimelate epimerase
MNLNATGNTFRIMEFMLDKPFRREWIRQHPLPQDGIIWIDRNRDLFHMDFYNCDGSSAKICGNGARACLYFLFKTLPLRQQQWISLSTDAGVLKGKVETDESVMVSMPEPQWVKTIDSKLGSIDLIDLGNRHIVLRLPSSRSVINADLFKIAGTIRDSSPELRACNVNVFANTGNEVWIRTFENGVEKETQSCGSGSTAVCFVLQQQNPVSLQSWLLHTVGGSLAVKFMAPDYYLQGKVVME